MNKLLNKSISIINTQKIKNISNSKRQYATKASFETSKFKLHKIQDEPKTTSTITKQEAHDIFKNMIIIRYMEQVLANMYQQKVVRGFLHLYSGEEAIAVGMKSVLSPKDCVITAYRCHGWCYLATGSVIGILAELAGKVSGLSKGKGGSMHIFADNFYGGNGIVGAQVPLGTGIGLAIKHQGKGTDTVSVTLYGDGAANQGQIYESYNIAKLHNLPIIYVCENNLYGMGTSVKRASANTDFYTRCEYIPGILADGMDVFAMREVTRFAKAWCTQGKGPIIIEARTYRYFGHSMSDPGVSYRSREEIKKVRQEHDPINVFKTKILEAKLISQEEVDKINKDAKDVVNKGRDLAMAAGVPPPDNLCIDIYSKNLGKTCRNVNLWTPLKVGTSGKSINLK